MNAPLRLPSVDSTDIRQKICDGDATNEEKNGSVSLTVATGSKEGNKGRGGCARKWRRGGRRVEGDRGPGYFHIMPQTPLGAGCGWQPGRLGQTQQRRPGQRESWRVMPEFVGFFGLQLNL